MNQDTGEIKMFDSDELVPFSWIPLNKGEVVQVKDCYFKIQGINIQQQQVILKAISKREAIETDAKLAGLK